MTLNKCSVEYTSHFFERLLDINIAVLIQSAPEITDSF
jgi:hypothetical protein